MAKLVGADLDQYYHRVLDLISEYESGRVIYPETIAKYLSLNVRFVRRLLELACLDHLIYPVIRVKCECCGNYFGPMYPRFIDVPHECLECDHCGQKQYIHTSKRATIIYRKA